MLETRPPPKRRAKSRCRRARNELGAPQVRDLPLPPDGPDWDDAASAVRAATAASDPAARRAALVAAAVASCAAYRVPADGLVDWWAARLPGER